MKKIIYILILMPILIVAQSKSVGVNTNTPTETFHVDGTTRINSLPANGATNAISTDTSGNYAPNQTLTASNTMVVDANGVIGYVEGLPVIKNPGPTTTVTYTTKTVPIDGNEQTTSEITIGNLSIRFDGGNTDNSNSEVSNDESTFSFKVENVAPENIIVNQLKIGNGGIFGGQNEKISAQPNTWYPMTKQAPRVSFDDFIQYSISFIETKEVYRLTGSVNDAITASGSRVASPAQVTLFLERLSNN